MFSREKKCITDKHCENVLNKPDLTATLFQQSMNKFT